jgi:hypothetical protein
MEEGGKNADHLEFFNIFMAQFGSIGFKIDE